MMTNATLYYNSLIDSWQFKEQKFNTFFEGLKMLSKDFEIVSWCYFLEDKKSIESYIKKNKLNNTPELKTFGSHLFLENTEYLEASNVYFNLFSVKENLEYDTWRVRSNTGFISSSIIQSIQNFQFPKSYKVTLAVLAYASYRAGGIVSVAYLSTFLKRKIKGLSDNEYIEFVSFTKKKQWILFYIISRFLFDKKSLFPIQYFWKNNYQKFTYHPKIWKESLESVIDISKKKIDAFIPTLGRPDFVYQTLLDIHNQGYQIDTFYIVEQKLPNQEDTLLEKTLSEKWNFKIRHILLNKLGLCNARNIGLSASDADYIIMFDDDIRIENQPKLLENLIQKLEVTNSKMISFATNNIQGNEVIKMSYSVAGCSTLFKNKSILPFNTQIEGFGSDDQEYNFNVHDKMQRIVFTSEEYMNHLKAPMGGWRFDAKKYLPWYQDNKIVPLPGPVTLYRYLKYATNNQMKGYKIFIFFKYYSFKIWKYGIFNKRWNKSLFWANEILNDKVNVEIGKGIVEN